MFSEVRHAILPLALRKIQRRGDLERAGLLIESLAKHWRDSRPFQLLIVAPRADVSLLRSNLPRLPPPTSRRLCSICTARVRSR